MAEARRVRERSDAKLKGEEEEEIREIEGEKKKEQRKFPKGRERKLGW